jgi:hypothetical protein
MPHHEAVVLAKRRSAAAAVAMADAAPAQPAVRLDDWLRSLEACIGRKTTLSMSMVLEDKRTRWWATRERQQGRRAGRERRTASASRAAAAP